MVKKPSRMIHTINWNCTYFWFDFDLFIFISKSIQKINWKHINDGGSVRSSRNSYSCIHSFSNATSLTDFISHKVNQSLLEWCNVLWFIIAVAIPVIVLNFGNIQPTVRGFFCNDESIRYPYHDSTISSTTLKIVSMFSNLVLVSCCVFSCF